MLAAVGNCVACEHGAEPRRWWVAALSPNATIDPAKPDIRAAAPAIVTGDQNVAKVKSILQ